MLIRFFGKKSLFYGFLAALFGAALGLIEILFAGLVVLLLKIIGVSEEPGFIGDIEPFASASPVYVLLLLIMIACARALCQIGKGYFAVAANEGFISRLRFMAIDNLLSDNNENALRGSKFYSLISDIFSKSALVFYGIVHSIPLILQALVIFGFMYVMSAYLSLVGFIFIIFVGFVVLLVQRKISSIAAPLSLYSDKLFAKVKIVLDNLLLIRIYRVSERERAEVSTVLKNYLWAIKHASLWSLISENIPNILGVLVVAYIVHQQLQHAYLNNAEFVSFLYLFLRYSQVLGQIASFSGNSLVNFPYFKRSFDFFASVQSSAGASASYFEAPTAAITNHQDKAQPAIAKLDKPPSLAISSVYFAFEDETIIDNVSLTLKAGEQLVITGPSGSGKSTFLNLLLGVLTPAQGAVTINHQSPLSFLDDYGADIGFVGPNAFLIEGSVADNLRFGNRNDITTDQMITILQQLGMDDWLKRFDYDLTLPLGEGAAAMSTGQGQRLSIARGLLRQPKLLILDEITANLDSKTEQDIVELVGALKGKTTIIIVTHSAMMEKHADHQLKMGM
ncbi:MAG: ATP-binding cassette domain-containing protein [Candidatus Puniceispirillaceae bacterium]